MRSSRGDVAVSRSLRMALRVYFVVFLVVLYLPTALLVIFSFNDSVNLVFPLQGFTTRFYRAAFKDRKSTRLNSSHLGRSRMPSSA